MLSWLDGKVLLFVPSLLVCVDSSQFCSRCCLAFVRLTFFFDLIGYRRCVYSTNQNDKSKNLLCERNEEGGGGGRAGNFKKILFLAFLSVLIRGKENFAFFFLSDLLFCFLQYCTFLYTNRVKFSSYFYCS